MDWVYVGIGGLGVFALVLLYRLFKDITGAYTDAAQYKHEAFTEKERANAAERANEVENRVDRMSRADVTAELRERWTRK